MIRHTNFKVINTMQPSEYHLEITKTQTKWEKVNIMKRKKKVMFIGPKLINTTSKR